MIKFSKDKVLLLHKLIAEETGGSIGVRDEALLDSALENAFAGFVRYADVSGSERDTHGVYQ